MPHERHKRISLGLCLCALAGFTASAFGQVEDVTSERPPGESPTRVEVAFYLIDLMKVIDTDETFEADVFILARWKDARLAGERVRVVSTDEVWMPNFVVFNQRDASRDLPDEVEIQADGTVTYRTRLIGTFASSLDLSRFPLDEQTLEIRLVLYGASTDEVVLVEPSDFAAARSPELSIADWEIGEPTTETSTFSPVPAITLSSLTVRFDARRLVGYYVVQMLIPLILIVAMSWVVFWVDPTVVTTRMSVCVTTVLTLIAYRFMVGGLVPKLSYLTRMDYLLLGTTLLVAGALATVAAGAYLVRQGRASSVAAVDRVARVAFPGGFVLLLVLLRLFG